MPGAPAGNVGCEVCANNDAGGIGYTQPVGRGKHKAKPLLFAPAAYKRSARFNISLPLDGEGGPPKVVDEV